MSHQQSADWMLGRVAEMLPEKYRGIYAPGSDVSAASPAA